MIIAEVVGWLFARDGTREVVATRAHVAGRPEQIWDRIMFYEDVPGRPAFPLRVLLPAPVRTEGDKSRVGETVRCAYTNGALAKRITAADAETENTQEFATARRATDGQADHGKTKAGTAFGSYRAVSGACLTRVRRCGKLAYVDNPILVFGLFLALVVVLALTAPRVRRRLTRHYWRNRTRL